MTVTRAYRLPIPAPLDETQRTTLSAYLSDAYANFAGITFDNETQMVEITFTSVLSNEQLKQIQKAISDLIQLALQTDVEAVNTFYRLQQKVEAGNPLSERETESLIELVPDPVSQLLFRVMLMREVRNEQDTTSCA